MATAGMLLNVTHLNVERTMEPCPCMFRGVGDSTIKGGGGWLHTVKTLLKASFKRTQRSSLLKGFFSS